MNAHTRITSSQRRSLVVRMRTHAFRTGMREGFAIPSLLTQERVYKYLPTIQGSVSGAWRAVGEAIEESLKGQDIGKETGPTNP